MSIAGKIGCVSQTLHEGAKKAEGNSGKRGGVPTEVADKVKALEREVAQQQDPARLSARARQDVALQPEIARVFAENVAVHSVRKVWRPTMREGLAVTRCTAITALNVAA